MPSKQHQTIQCKETIVAPAKGSAETKWLLLVASIIISICAATISARTAHTVQNRTESWQLNAFTDFNSQETGVFNGLLNAAYEIGHTHDYQNGHWMEIRELEEFYIPPFVKDAAWKKQGNISWEQKVISVNNRHMALYKGVPANDTIGGSFLLLMLHEHKKKQGNAAKGPTHAPYEIWFHTNVDQKFPVIITDQALINAGWREVIALTGEDEVLRTKGKTIQ